MRAELHPFRLPLRTPLITGGVAVRFRAGFLVSLSADGLIGWGEASPLPGRSQTSLLDTEAALRLACDRLDAGGEAALGPLLEAMHGTPHARAAVAGAWADLRAQRAGQTLAAHISPGDGSEPVAEVKVNALVTDADPGGVAEAALRARAASFEAVKLKVGVADARTDTARVRAAREALGPDVELRLDANGAWDPADALAVLAQTHHCDIAYCEEPVAGIEEMAVLARRSPVPFAVDESMRDQHDAARALDLGLGTLIVKPQALGGPDIALAIAARAGDAGASAVVTSFMDSAVGVAHALAVAAAVDASAPPGTARRAHGLATSALLAADVCDPPQVVDSRIRVPRGPGIGVSPELRGTGHLGQRQCPQR